MDANKPSTKLRRPRAIRTGRTYQTANGTRYVCRGLRPSRGTALMALIEKDGSEAKPVPMSLSILLRSCLLEPESGE